MTDFLFESNVSKVVKGTSLEKHAELRGPQHKKPWGDEIYDIKVSKIWNHAFNWVVEVHNVWDNSEGKHSFEWVACVIMLPEKLRKLVIHFEKSDTYQVCPDKHW